MLVVWGHACVYKSTADHDIKSVSSRHKCVPDPLGFFYLCKRLIKRRTVEGNCYDLNNLINETFVDKSSA